MIIVLAGFSWIATFGAVVGADLSTQRDTVAARQFKHYSIYFIEAVGLSRIKIGFFVNPEDRVRQLSTGSPTELKLIAKVPGDANKEKELHEKFKHLLFEKEWFHFTKELQEYVDSWAVFDTSGDIPVAFDESE